MANFPCNFSGGGIGKNGGVSEGEAFFRKGTAVAEFDLSDGNAAKYVHICSLYIRGVWRDKEISFGITQRSRGGTVRLRFGGEGHRNPSVAMFEKTGEINIFLSKTVDGAGQAVFGIFLEKSNAFDFVTITWLAYGIQCTDGIILEWEGINTESLPEGSMAAVYDHHVTGSMAVTEEGYMADARQLNKDIGGSFASVILKLLNCISPVGFESGGITECKDLDNPPRAFIFETAVGAASLPSLGSNRCTVIQRPSGDPDFNAQIAFSFGSDRIAIRRRHGSATWTAWKYLDFS